MIYRMIAVAVAGLCVSALPSLAQDAPATTVGASAPASTAPAATSSAWLEELGASRSRVRESRTVVVNPPGWGEDALDGRPSTPPPNEPRPDFGAEAREESTYKPREEKEYPPLTMPTYWPIGLRRMHDGESWASTFMAADYNALLMSGRNTSDTGHALGMTRHEAGASLTGNTGIGPASLVQRVRAWDIHTKAALPTTPKRFPSQLWDVQTEGMFPSVLPVPGLYDIALGSASDRPFANGNTWTADITYMIGPLVDPSGELDPPSKQHFIFLLNWANNREFMNRQVYPGFEYRYYSQPLVVTAGFPYTAATWRPSKQFELEAEYQFVRNVHAQATYKPIDKLALFAGFDWTNQQWLLYDRTDKDDRLFYYEKRLSTGVRWSPSKNWFVELSGGWAFDRMFFEGERFEDRHNSLQIEDGPFIGLRAAFRW